MRNLDELLTTEMNNEEWAEYRRQWIASYARDLVIECGQEESKDNLFYAEIRFEDYCGQEGYTMRNELICEKRQNVTK